MDYFPLETEGFRENLVSLVSSAAFREFKVIWECFCKLEAAPF